MSSPWEPFAAMAERRGLTLPPPGREYGPWSAESISADGADADVSPREMLWHIYDGWPSHVVAWADEAPPDTSWAEIAACARERWQEAFGKRYAEGVEAEQRAKNREGRERDTGPAVARYDPLVVTFGRWHGSRWEDLSSAYLMWLVESAEQRQVRERAATVVEQRIARMRQG